MTESKETQVKEQLNIRLVLDRSGSMSSCRVETVESINEYITEIQKEAVEGVFTLSTFDNRSFDIPISRIPIRELTTLGEDILCLLYTSPSPRDVEESRMPSSA